MNETIKHLKEVPNNPVECRKEASKYVKAANERYEDAELWTNVSTTVGIVGSVAIVFGIIKSSSWIIAGGVTAGIASAYFLNSAVSDAEEAEVCVDNAYFCAKGAGFTDTREYVRRKSQRLEEFEILEMDELCRNAQ